MFYLFLTQIFTGNGDFPCVSKKTFIEAGLLQSVFQLACGAYCVGLRFASISMASEAIERRF